MSLQSLKLDLESQTDKVQRLDRELRDMTTSERDDKEVNICMFIYFKILFIIIFFVWLFLLIV